MCVSICIYIYIYIYIYLYQSEVVFCLYHGLVSVTMSSLGRSVYIVFAKKLHRGGYGYCMEQDSIRDQITETIWMIR